MWTHKDRLLATKMEFQLALADDIPRSKALAVMKRWDKFVAEHNRKASVSANNAWHTSPLWVLAEAEAAIKTNAMYSIISIICAFAVVLLFTRDVFLALCAVVLVLSITSGVAFFIVVITPSTFGAIEAISLVVFIGYSVAYILNVADTFGREMKSTDLTTENEQPEVCMERAVLKIGGATLGSAITTLCTGIFAACCTLQIFVRLGLVVIVATLVSTFFGLVVLPALLIVVRFPARSFQRKRGERRFFALYCCRLRKEHAMTSDAYRADDDGDEVPGHRVF